MITSEKHLLYILGVNKEQLDYLLAHIEDYYYSFERVKLNKFTGKPKKNSNGEIATRQINSSKELSEYEVMRTNSIAKKNRAIQTKLEKVLNYTKQTMVAYMSEEDLNRLCAYVAEYSSGDTLQKISPVKVDSQLKSIDIMHFGWNIGKAFGRKRIHTATFIKNVFAQVLCDLEISTIERKMSHTESACYIKLDKGIS